MNYGRVEMAAFAEETEAKNQLGHISEGDASIEERERQNRELKEGLHPLKVSRFLSSCSFFFSSYCPSFSTTFFFYFYLFVFYGIYLSGYFGGIVC